MIKFKKFLLVFLFLVFAVLIVYGILLGDFGEIKANGSVLCLSCIGIG